MFGLILFGILGVWACLSVTISYWLGGFVSSTYWRIAARIALVPFVFFAPVADEIVAWPEMRELCKGTDNYQFAHGMDEKSAYGRTVYYTSGPSEIRTLVSGPRVRYERFDYVDSTTRQPVLSYFTVEPIGSMFAFPDAGGGRHTWILRGCGFSPRDSVESRNARKAFFSERLKLMQIPTP